MAYKNNIPAPTDYLAQSQLDIRNNFIEVEDTWGERAAGPKDHISLNEPEVEKRGMHRRLTLPEQASDPTTAASEAALYCKDDSGSSELYYRRESDGTVGQLTSGGKFIQPGLTLAAFCVFDAKGNIIKQSSRDEDGEVTNTPLSFNVASVVPDPADPQVFTITYSSAISTADYFWVITSVGFVGTSPTPAYPLPASTYSSAFNTTRAVVLVSPLPIGPGGLKLNNFQFQIFTVT